VEATVSPEADEGAAVALFLANGDRQHVHGASRLTIDGVVLGPENSACGRLPVRPQATRGYRCLKNRAQGKLVQRAVCRKREGSVQRGVQPGPRGAAIMGRVLGS